jgi:C-terminal processing protease CtpA/Prc
MTGRARTIAVASALVLLAASTAEANGPSWSALGGPSVAPPASAASGWHNGRGHATAIVHAQRGRSVGEAGEWCDHIASGAAGRGGGLLDVELSAAHALVREFSVASSYGVADRALVPALAGGGALTNGGVGAALKKYAGALADVCARPAGRGGLGDAQVRRVGDVAIVRPGRGTPAIPANARLAVLDLRDLPAVDGLDAALRRAAGAVSATPVRLPARIVRSHDGPVDEVRNPFNVYSTGVAVQQRYALAATGARDLPLIVLTGARAAPAAARLAGALRVARRAWVLGEDIWSAVAETSWRSVGRAGIAARTSLLTDLVPGADEHLPAQQAAQDDPHDPSAASYRHDLVLEPGTALLDIRLTGRASSDIDLFLMRDSDGDGSFAFPRERAAYSASAGSDERVQLSGALDPGRYQVWVQGYWVPSPTDGLFDLDIASKTGAVWPDVIPADSHASPADDRDVAARARALAQTPLESVRGPVARSAPEPVTPFGDVHPIATGKSELRAALITVHGMMRLWFPYFAVVGDRIDSRLHETLGAVQAWDGEDRAAAVDILRRFGEALHDGHQVTASVTPIYAGYLPVYLEDIGGLPVIRRSTDPALHPGDTILAIDGRSSRQIYEEQFRKTSAATPGHQFDLASQWVVARNQPATLKLQDPAGSVRTVVVDPQSPDRRDAAAAPGVSDRASGPLADLGAGELYYLNMNFFTSPTSGAVRAALADAVARDARALVLDMRGYPGADINEVAARLIRQPFVTPQFGVTARLGPDDSTLRFYQFPAFPIWSPPVWNRPIVLLTGSHAVSNAENFMQRLTRAGADRVAAVVGRRSAGTNGDITGVQLPGGFVFIYTGMELRNPDGTTFHGVGIAPDIPVTTTATDLRDGVDPDLLSAIEYLRTQ